jgi:hypothetical protein
MKIHLKKRQERLLPDGKQKSMWNQVVDLGGRMGAAGSSKLLAIVVTYPHEARYPTLYSVNISLNAD